MLLCLFLPSVYLAATVTNCATASRLCIEEPKIIEGKPIDIFYPVNLFPIDVDSSTLSIGIYLSTSSFNFNPCEIPEALVATIPVVPESTNVQFINSTRITVQLDKETKDKLGQNKQYILQLSDRQKRQCILGPNIRGTFQSNVEIELRGSSSNTPATTRVPNPTGGPSEPTNAVPSNFDLSSSNIIILIIFCIVLAVAVFVAVIACRNRLSKRVAMRDPNWSRREPRTSIGSSAAGSISYPNSARDMEQASRQSISERPADLQSNANMSRASYRSSLRNELRNPPLV
jgi:hypothetical protein